MMLILLVLNLPALARMILRRTSTEIAMPNDPPDDKRSPKETAHLARDVMRRMMASPPKPHEKLTKKKFRSRRK
jgi:hypothetical protein